MLVFYQFHSRKPDASAAENDFIFIIRNNISILVKFQTTPVPFLPPDQLLPLPIPLPHSVCRLSKPFMGKPDFSDAFKHDAAVQVTERGYPAADVSQRALVYKMGR